MFRKKIIIICALLNMFFAPYTVAQDIKQAILFYGSGDYSFLMTNADNFSSKAGCGFGIGAGYEFQYKKFIVQTGVGFMYQSCSLQLTDFSLDKNLIDTEGDSYIGHLKFMNNHENYKLGNINIPLLFGARVGSLYILTGAKLGLNILGNSLMQSTVATTATYPQFIDDFENMPDHLLSQSKVSAEYPVKLELNCSLSGEVGLFIGANPTSQSMRLSLFVDYGLLNVRNDAVADDLILDKIHGVPFEPVLNSFLLSNNMVGSKLNSFCIGVKFTYALGLKGSKYCHCQDYKDLNKKYRR